MINWKKGLASVAVVGLGFILAACDGSSTKETATSSAAGAGGDAISTCAIGGDPSSTSPINTSDRWGLTVTNMIYSPLITVETDGTTQGMLAELVEPAEDGLSSIVHLKQDVKWSDGGDFTADDVIFTCKQKVEKESGNADSLWIDDQPIMIEKVNEYTVRFVLPTPSTTAISNIATEIYIILKHIFENVSDFSISELPEKSVGTGPYQLKEYERGEYLTFEANESYYDGKPSIQNVALRVIESTDTAKVALQKGEVDAVVVLLSNIEDLDDAQISIHPYTGNRIGYLDLNTHSDALQDVKVRQAVLFTLNRDELNQAAYLDEDYYVTPYSFLPPNNPYVTEDVKRYETNAERAKGLLREAGVTDLSLNLAFNSIDPAQAI